MTSEIAEKLESARQRTRQIVDRLSDEDLYGQHDPLMSPIAWDLGHIGNFEEMWGIRSLPASGDLFPQLDEMYDAVKNPRATRSALPLPERKDLWAYLDAIRQGLFQAAERNAESSDPLLTDDFVYHMLLQHELQHQETILQTLQLKRGEPFAPGIPPRGLPPGDATLVGRFVELPGGSFTMGTDRVAGVYDNERTAHRRQIEPFRIGTVPVTNGEFLEFVEAGGYRQRDLWQEEGWRFITDQRIVAPKYWERRDEQWHERVLDQIAPLDPLRPVCHVCWYEADAYARFAGKRLPSEAEWEYAARFDPATGRSRSFPWGEEAWTPERANLDLEAFRPAQVGAFPAGASAFGVHGLLGDVWEWTASTFEQYPGFEAFPYEEYSAIFFGQEYRVLRGGSWVTAPDAARATFRNWDFPIRRQIFAGFRLAEDPQD